MKFLVSDCQADRHKKIRKFLTPEMTIIAALLAVVDLEWTIRRVIDRAAGGDKKLLEPTRISGLEQYAKAWKKVLCSTDAKALRDVVGEWDKLVDAYQLRHDIVHGRQGTGGVNYVAKRVDRMLAASKAIAEYGCEYGADPYRRVRKAILTGPTVKKKM